MLGFGDVSSVAIITFFWNGFFCVLSWTLFIFTIINNFNHIIIYTLNTEIDLRLQNFIEFLFLI